MFKKLGSVILAALLVLASPANAQQLPSVGWGTPNSPIVATDGDGNISISGSITSTGAVLKDAGGEQIDLENLSGAIKGYIGTNGIFGTAGLDDLRIRSDASNIVFGFNGQPYFNMGNTHRFSLYGSSSGNTSLQALPNASGNLTLPSRTATLVTTGDAGSVLYGKDYGIVADGVTSDDAHLASAATACANANTTLILPAGEIAITGTQTVSLNSCKLVGVGSGINATTFLFTSTTQQPFTLLNNVHFDNINFFWPNQGTAVTAYPSLFTDTSIGAANISFDHVHVLNAYRIFSPNASSVGQGRWYAANSSFYALAPGAFQFANTGDWIWFSNISFDPGDYLQFTNFANKTKNTIANANTSNSIIEMLDKGAGTSGVTLYMDNVGAFAWGKFFLMDAGSLWSFGDIQMSSDGVPTILDSTSNGQLGNVTISCRDCTSGVGSYTGQSLGTATAFALGNSGSLHLNQPVFNPVQGSFLTTTGANVFINGGDVAYAQNNTADFYFIQGTGGAGSLHIDVNGTYYHGVPSSVHSRGITTTIAAAGERLIGNRAQYTNEAFNLNLGAGEHVVVGNTVENTQGSSSFLSSGTGSVTYSGNRMDKPPAPAFTNASSGSGSNSPNGGIIAVGSTNPTTSLTMTMPFTIANGHCSFFINANVPLWGSSTGSPQVYTLNTSTDFHNDVIEYNCSSGQ